MQDIINKIVEAEETVIEEKEPEKALVCELDEKVVYVDADGMMTDEDYYMISDLFYFDELKAMEDFGIKRYKNALFKG